MNIKLIFWSVLAKSLATASRLAGKGRGTAISGLLVEKHNLELLKDLGKGYQEMIWISGTNGKTTTRSILTGIYKDAGVAVCSNLGGANILRGIAASLLFDRNWIGQPKARVAILEVEEASMPILAKYIIPDKLILTNIFRDQLDVYGEVDKTLHYFKETLKLVQPHVFINGDDKKLLQVVNGYSSPVSTFSVEGDLKPDFEALNKSHADTLEISAKQKFSIIGKNQTQALVKIGEDKQYLIPRNIPGDYNLYNILAAFAVAYDKFGKETASYLKTVAPVFGRGEKILLDKTPSEIFLVKNPAGFNQVLQYLSTNFAGQGVGLAVLVNDQTADGKDVSWLWDIHLEKFAKLPIIDIYTGGTRGLDMLLRLEYAGFKVSLEDNLSGNAELYQKITSKNRPVVVLATYTAMMEWRKFLQTKIKLSNFDDQGN